jgi:signal transduction histidine kinase
LANVLNNAREACGGCGRVDVSATLAAGETPRVRILVVDDGVGPPPALLQRAASDAFSTKTPPEGHGLGLSVAREMIAAHGGLLTIAPGAASGACVTIDLPSAPT